MKIQVEHSIKKETEKIIEQLDCMACHFLSIVEDHDVEDMEYHNAVKCLFYIVDIVEELTGEELDAAKRVREIDLKRAYARHGSKEKYEKHIAELIKKMKSDES